MRVMEAGPRCLEIGLVNNMPDPALEATERQFRTLLNTAADGIPVQLTLYALPDVPRSDEGRSRVHRLYADIGDLWNRRLDGLIVTGAEPRAANLAEEPYWGSLTKLMAWAEDHTDSAVWSCLAAHATVLHIDGIARRPLGGKRFGVFECASVSNHALLAGAPGRIRMPHSRWNDIPEEALLACDYQVLTRSDGAGVDAFVKQGKSLFVFFQGHPEYETVTLLIEYRRDIKRFLDGERETYPAIPDGYFDSEALDALTAMEERARLDRRQDLIADFPTDLVTGSIKNTWGAAATGIYRNWLLHLHAQKERRLRAR